MPTGKNMYGAARDRITKINLNIKWMRINNHFEWSNLKNRAGSAVGFQSWAQGKVKESKRPTYDWSMGSSFTSADTHDIRRRSSNSTATRAPVWSGRKSLVIMQNSRREESNFSMQMVKFPPARTSVQWLLIKALMMSGGRRYAATLHVGHSWNWSSQMPEVSLQKKSHMGQTRCSGNQKRSADSQQTIWFPAQSFSSDHNWHVGSTWTSSWWAANNVWRPLNLQPSALKRFLAQQAAGPAGGWGWRHLESRNLFWSFQVSAAGRYRTETWPSEGGSRVKSCWTGRRPGGRPRTCLSTGLETPGDPTGNVVHLRSNWLQPLGHKHS